MSRNIQLNILRGALANMPSLNVGELYLCTDTFELYAGTLSGNTRVGVSNNVKVGTGNISAQAPSSVTGGPVNPRKPTAFAEIVIDGAGYWLPLFQ